MRGRRAVITGNPNPRAGLAETEGGSARWYPATNSPEVRAPPAARLARLVFGRRTSSRRRLPRPNAEPFPSKPPSAARRPLVDGVRTRERAVAGRLGAAPYAAPSTNVKASPKSSRTSTNGFGFGLDSGSATFFFRRRNRFGFSVSRRLFARGDKLLRRVGRRRRSTPRTGARLFVVSNVAASRVFARHFVRGVLLDDDRRRTRSYSVVVLFVEERRIRDETNDGRFPRRGERRAFLSAARGGGDGSSRRVSVADRYRTRDGVVDDRFLVCVSRLVRCSIPSPPGPGSSAGRAASQLAAVLRNARAS